MNAFEVVRLFEERVASFAGSRYAVAVDCCTSAVFLSCKYAGVTKVTLPARTYISVPMAIIHAGGVVEFEDIEWAGIYRLKPYEIYDGSKRFRAGMYVGGLHCLSFHAKKHLNIGRGGMILADDEKAVKWLKKARYDGREGRPYPEEKVTSLGWHMYMTPEQAARGLQLLDILPENLPDQVEDYPDLREMPVFR